jgi:hypothetical protein
MRLGAVVSSRRTSAADAAAMLAPAAAQGLSPTPPMHPPPPAAAAVPATRTTSTAAAAGDVGQAGQALVSEAAPGAAAAVTTMSRQGSNLRAPVGIASLMALPRSNSGQLLTSSGLTQVAAARLAALQRQREAYVAAEASLLSEGGEASVLSAADSWLEQHSASILPAAGAAAGGVGSTVPAAAVVAAAGDSSSSGPPAQVKKQVQYQQQPLQQPLQQQQQQPELTQAPMSLDSSADRLALSGTGQPCVDSSVDRSRSASPASSTPAAVRPPDLQQAAVQDPLVKPAAGAVRSARSSQHSSSGTPAKWTAGGQLHDVALKHLPEVRRGQVGIQLKF